MMKPGKVGMSSVDAAEILCHCASKETKALNGCVSRHEGVGKRIE